MPRIRNPKPSSENDAAAAWAPPPQQYGGDDPLHPVVQVFAGFISEVDAWSRKAAKLNDMYRQFCANVGPSPAAEGSVGFRDPGPSVYLYSFGSESEIVYIGITRNPVLRFRQHKKKGWWKRVTLVSVGRFDCRYHDGPVCTTLELDRAARSIEAWWIDVNEPTENIVSGPID